MTKQWDEFSAILQPSSLGGVGVFAAHDISKDTPIFTLPFQVKIRKLAEIPEVFQKYCIYLNDGECKAPVNFAAMEVGWFINHSFEPNVVKKSEELIVAARDIKAGEELLVDYNQLNEPEDKKEDYYQR